MTACTPVRRIQGGNETPNILDETPKQERKKSSSQEKFPLTSRAILTPHGGHRLDLTPEEDDTDVPRLSLRDIEKTPDEICSCCSAVKDLVVQKICDIFATFCLSEPPMKSPKQPTRFTWDVDLENLPKAGVYRVINEKTDYIISNVVPPAVRAYTL